MPKILAISVGGKNTTLMMVNTFTMSFCSILMRPSTASSMKLILLERNDAYSDKEFTSRETGRSGTYKLSCVLMQESSLPAKVIMRNKLTKASRWRVIKSPTRPSSSKASRKSSVSGESSRSLRRRCDTNTFLESASSSVPNRSNTSA